MFFTGHTNEVKLQENKNFLDEYEVLERLGQLVVNVNVIISIYFKFKYRKTVLCVFKTHKCITL